MFTTIQTFVARQMNAGIFAKAALLVPKADLAFETPMEINHPQIARDAIILPTKERGYTESLLTCRRRRQRRRANRY